MRHWLFGIVLGTQFVSAVGTAGEAATSEASLSQSSVPARGRQEAILEVSGFGRYAVTATSSQGTAVQLISRMTGPGPLFGTAGEANGRVDAFLDRGTYKVVVQSHDKGSGNVKIEVHSFKEVNREPQLLVELKPVATKLRDFEQASWWIEIGERRSISLEAAGRDLADMRLWKDGNWLVDATPETTIMQPVLGRPLTLCRIAVDLEPGLYRLSTYGGPPLAWAEDNKEHPLHLRYGIPVLPTAGRARRVIGPFGYDSYLVPGKATFFRVELDEARPLTLAVGSFNPQSPFASGARTAQIEKKSIPPVAEVMASQDSGFHRVSVSGSAGQAYVLQHFERSTSYRIEERGRYWVSSVHSGHAGDSIDATALVVEVSASEKVAPLAASVVELDGSHLWQRRFNLLGQATLYLRVKEKGKYEISAQGEGVEGRYRIEPMLLTRPPRYKSPPFSLSGTSFDLGEGWYVLTAEPVKRGIVELTIKPTGILNRLVNRLTGSATSTSVLAAAQFQELQLDSRHGYLMLINSQPGVSAAAVVRKLPLDLSEPLPVMQVAGSTISVPFVAREEGVLRARDENGKLIDLSVDGAAPAKEATVAAGEHTARLVWQGKDTVIYSLGLEPRRLLATTPLPLLSEEAKKKLPSFPVLGEGRPQFFDLERTASSTFLLKADKAGLFQVQSTGLLATEAAMRTRTVVALDRAQENGVGRNFLIQQYLREGDYQVTVRARGESQGHLGVELVRTRMIDSGELKDGVPARTSVPAGDAVLYRFTVEEAGTYSLRALGLNKSFRCRLEDKDGWPLLPPNGPASIAQHFEPGTYRLVVLPEPVAARQLVLLERLVRPERLAGHGPHPLPLGSCVTNEWLEPEGTAERLPDRFELRVPAPVNVQVSLDGEMEGRLFRVGKEKSRQEVGYVSARAAFRGELAAGAYEVETRCLRANNHVQYSLCASPRELVAGLSRELSAPAQLPISVGQAGLVELSSFGTEDVRARLVRASGELVTRDDDRSDDWNFHIAASLEPGRYNLLVDPVGEQSAGTTVSMLSPKEQSEGVLTLPAKIEAKPGSGVLVYPLQLPAKADFLAVAVSAGESAGIAVERQVNGRFVPVGSETGRRAHLEVPLGKEPGVLRLRVWSVDRRGSALAVSAGAFEAKTISEGKLARGAVLDLVPGDKPGLAVAAVELERPGVLRLQGDAQGLRYATEVGAAARAPENGMLVVPGKTLWLAKPGSKAPSVKAVRVTLAGDDAPLAVTVPAGQALLIDGARGDAGPVAIMASSRVGQPGVRVTSGDDDEPDAKPDMYSMAVGEHAALAVALAVKKPMGVVWSASSASESLEARVRLLSYKEPKEERVEGGRLEGTLAYAQARRFVLPAGAKTMRVVASPGTGVVLSSAAAVLSVHWNADRPVDETLDSRATHATVLGAANGEGHFLLEAVLSGQENRALTLRAPLERATLGAGTLRVQVATDESGPTKLYTRGSPPDRKPVLVGIDGRVQRGAEVVVPPGGGTLLLPHGEGWALAWLERGGGAWAGREGQATPVDPPASVPLNGELAALSIKLAQPTVLHLRAPLPVVVRVSQPGQPPQVVLQPAGLALDTWLAKGEALVSLRPLGGAKLWGSAVVSTSAVAVLKDGAGPEVLLAPGDTRYYSFTVERGGPVGIGVRSDSDSVQATLLDLKGTSLGTGVAQMPDLATGAYLLEVHVSGSVPAVVRPAVVGLVAPDTGPPEDVKRQYVQSPDDAGASFTAQRVYRPSFMMPTDDESSSDGEYSSPSSGTEPSWEQGSDGESEGYSGDGSESE